MIKKVPLYPIVRQIPLETFATLLSANLTEHDRKIVLSFRKAQDEYKILTKRKYAYFWTIYNKHFTPVELEYPDTVSFVEFDAPIPLLKKKFTIRTITNANSKRWNQK